MAITEDFSFPKLITSTNPINNINNNNSPLSLWRISSLVYPDQEEQKQGDQEQDQDQDYGVIVRKHKSFSEIEVGDSETRMDLLWEDFNKKELQRVSSLGHRTKTRPVLIRSEDNYVANDVVNINNSCYSDDDVVVVRDRRASSNLVQGLKLKVSKTKDCLVRQPKRTSTVVFLRALGKLFSLHNLTRGKKNT